jgi:hypothetical protein
VGVSLVWQAPVESAAGEQSYAIDPLIAGDGVDIVDSGEQPGVRIQLRAGEITRVATAADQAIATTTLTAIGGLQLDLAAGTAYAITGLIPYQCSGTGVGLRINQTNTATGSTVTGRYSAQATASAHEVLPFGASNAASPAAGTAYLADVDIICTTGATAGTLTLQAAANAAGTLTVQAGAYLVLRRLGPATVVTGTLAGSLGAASSYQLSAQAYGRGTSAWMTLSINQDGTWAATAPAGAAVTGSPLSGSWATPSGAGLGDGYQVRFTTSAVGGVASVSNGAADWVPISTARTWGCSVTTPVNTYRDGNATVLVEVRKQGTTSPVCSSTLTVWLDAQSYQIEGGIIP